jgi:putative endonuclease
LIYSGAKNLNNSNTKSSGKKGEDLAEEFLLQRGYKIISRNYYGGKYGEIDIIAQKESLIVFVEVKSRSNDHFGGGIYSIGNSKKKHLRKAAEHFLSKNDNYNNKSFTFRFDLIIVQKGEVLQVEDILR